MSRVRGLDYEIAGVGAVTGAVVPMETWAREARLPAGPGGAADGEALERILGLRSKSWEPARFEGLEPALTSARAALASAGLAPGDVEAALVVTGTPCQEAFDQDAFWLLRELQVPDEVVPLQLSGGGAGLLRAVAAAATLSARVVLVVAYGRASWLTGDPMRPLGSLYPAAAEAPPSVAPPWVSAALLADGAAALVLRRRPGAGGVVLYSRDALAFGAEPGFHESLLQPLGTLVPPPPGAHPFVEHRGLGESGERVRHYLTKGLMLNHAALRLVRPGYVDEVDRIYVHQPSPILLDTFLELSGLPAHKVPAHVREFGDLGPPCVASLLHADVLAGRVGDGRPVCILAVGGGPERGALIAPVSIPSPPARRTP